MVTFNAIKQIIVDTVKAADSNLYETPLVGLVNADHPGFTQLNLELCSGHLLPSDILPGAKTVISFFLPFTKQVTKSNGGVDVAREWAAAYIKTNALIGQVCTNIHQHLITKGINSAWQKATHNFDEKRLVSFWSHKSVAYLCGLGSFGVHQMLITVKGSAGRFGSIVLDTDLYNDELSANTKLTVKKEYCLYYQGKNCLVCVKNCPTGALQATCFDRAKCYKWLLEVNDSFPDLELCDVCGKCLLGPCAHQGSILS